MKKLYYLILLLLVTVVAAAQEVSVTDLQVASDNTITFNISWGSSRAHCAVERHGVGVR